jgi:hypothetical protein
LELWNERAAAKTHPPSFDSIARRQKRDQIERAFDDPWVVVSQQLLEWDHEHLEKRQHPMRRPGNRDELLQRFGREQRIRLRHGGVGSEDQWFSRQLGGRSISSRSQPSTRRG